MPLTSHYADVSAALKGAAAESEDLGCGHSCPYKQQTQDLNLLQSFTIFHELRVSRILGIKKDTHHLQFDASLMKFFSHILKFWHGKALLTWALPFSESVLSPPPPALTLRATGHLPQSCQGQGPEVWGQPLAPVPLMCLRPARPFPSTEATARALPSSTHCLCLLLLLQVALCGLTCLLPLWISEHVKTFFLHDRHFHVSVSYHMWLWQIPVNLKYLPLMRSCHVFLSQLSLFYEIDVIVLIWQTKQLRLRDGKTNLHYSMPKLCRHWG